MFLRTLQATSDEPRLALLGLHVDSLVCRTFTGLQARVVFLARFPAFVSLEAVI